MKLLPAIAKLAIHPVQTAKSIKGFFVIDNLDEQITKLNNAKQAATDYWDAMNVEGQSKELAAQAGMMKDLDKETKELIVTSRNRAHAEEVLTNKIRVQTGAQKLLNNTISAGVKIAKTAGSIVLSIAISYAISEIISWIDKLVNAEKKEKELAKERAEEAKQQLETQKQYVKDIRDITKEYEELGKVTNKTEEQKQALVDLQNQLVETFGEEAKGIDLVNGKYEDQIKLLQQKTKEQYQQQYYESLEPYQNAKDNYDNNVKNTIDFLSGAEQNYLLTPQDASSIDVSISLAKQYVENGEMPFGVETYGEDLIKYIAGLITNGEDVDSDKTRNKIKRFLQKRNYLRWGSAVSDYSDKIRSEEVDLLEEILKIPGVDFDAEGVILSDNLNASEKVSTIDKILDTLDKESSKEYKNTELYRSIVTRLSELKSGYQSQIDELEKQRNVKIEGWVGSFTSSSGITYNDLLGIDIEDSDDFNLFYDKYREYKDEVVKDYSGDTDELVKYLEESLVKVKNIALSKATHLTTQTDFEFIEDIFDAYSEDIDNLKTKVSEFDDYLEKIKSGSLTSAEEIELFKLYPELVGVDDLHGALTDLKENAVSQLVDEMSQINVPEHLQDELDYLIEKIKSLSSAAETELSLSDFVDLIEKQYDINKINEQISNLEKLRDKEASYYDEKISKLQEANEEQEKANELEEAYQELERARTQKTLKVWRSGVGWTWETDKSAIEEAKSTVISLEQEKEISALEKSKEAVVSKYDAQIESLNEYKDKLEEHKSSYQTYVDDMNSKYEQERLNSMGLTLDLKGELDQRVADLEEYKEKVISVLSGFFGDESDENTSNENTSSGKTLNLGKKVANSILLAGGGVVDGDKILNQMKYSGWMWAWEKNPLSSYIPNSNVSNNQTQYNTYSFGDIIANNPTEFIKEMGKYLKDNTTKGIIK